MLNKIPSRLLVVLLVVVAYIACRVGVNWSQRHQARSQAASVACADGIPPARANAEKPVVYGRVAGTLVLGRKVTLWLLPDWSDETLTFTVDIGQYDRSKEITTGIVYVCGDAWYSASYVARSEPEPKRAKTLEGVESQAQESPKVGTIARFASFGAAK